MKNIIKYLKNVISEKIDLHRLERIKKWNDELIEDSKSKYVFDFLCMTAEQDYKIEIFIKKVNSKCEYNHPKFIINGKDVDVPYYGNILTSLRRAYEQYKIIKI